jgi:hypothetical protein
MGTAGRRVGRAQVDMFFFQNRTLPASYPCPSRVHRYHKHGYHGYGYRYSGTDTPDNGHGYPFTHLYPDTDINTPDNEYGFTSMNSTRRFLPNLSIWSRYFFYVNNDSVRKQNGTTLFLHTLSSLPITSML